METPQSETCFCASATIIQRNSPHSSLQSTMTESLSTKTLLPVVVAADNFPSSPLTDPYPSRNPTTGERLVPFHLTFADHHAALPPLGYIRQEVLAELEQDEREPTTCPWQFHSSAVAEEDGDLDLRVECVFFAEWVIEGGSETMGKVMQETAERWREEGKFPGPLGGEQLCLWKGVYSRQAGGTKSTAYTPRGNLPRSNTGRRLVDHSQTLHLHWKDPLVHCSDWRHSAFISQVSLVCFSVSLIPSV